jgi:hypothetical protein
MLNFSIDLLISWCFDDDDGESIFCIIPLFFWLKEPRKDSYPFFEGYCGDEIIWGCRVEEGPSDWLDCLLLTWLSFTTFLLKLR